MQLLKTLGWKDYELLDSGNGQRLERFGQYVISKPDPQAIWQPSLSVAEWNKADAKFLERDWDNNQLPAKWPLLFKEIKFYAKLTPFKHTGVFPEQVLNWQFIMNKLKTQNLKPKDQVN